MRRPVLLAAITALAVRLVVAARLPAPAVWDGATYARLALHLVRGDGYVDGAGGFAGEHATASLPVGYPALIAFLAARGPDLDTAARAVNVAAGVVAAILAAAIGVRASGPRGGYLAGLACALAPGAALWTTAVMPESLAAALVLGSCALVLVAVETPWRRMGLAVASGVVVGAAALVTPHHLLAAPFVGALTPGRRPVRILAAAVGIVTALLVALPWSVRNCAALGRCVLGSTDDGVALYHGTRGDTDDQTTTRDLLDPGCALVLDEVARERCHARIAIRTIRHRPLAWLGLDAIKLARTVSAERAPVRYLRDARPDAFPLSSADRAVLVCTLWWWSLAAAAFVGARRIHRAGPVGRASARITGLWVVLVLADHVVFVGGDRFHLVLVPVLSALAAGIWLPANRDSLEPEAVWAS